MNQESDGPAVSALVILISHVKNHMMLLGPVAVFRETLTQSFQAVETKEEEETHFPRLQLAMAASASQKDG